MALEDRLNIINRLSTANKIIVKYEEVVQCFEDWFALIKANNLDKAEKQVIKAKNARIEIADLKKQYEKLNKKSGIILLNNRIKGGN